MSSTTVERGLRRGTSVFGLLEVAVCAVILGWVVIGTFAPDLVLRTFRGTAPMAAALLLGAALTVLRSGMRVRFDGPYLMFYVFLGAGFLSVVLSYLDFPKIADLPRDGRFIIRHAYFLVLLPLALLASTLFWRRRYVPLFAFCRRYFWILAPGLILADWGTAYFIGDEHFAQFNDYDIYLEKGTVWLLFAFIYLAKAVSTPRFSWACLGVLLVYFAGSQALAYGSLFQASTGSLIFLTLAIVTVLRIWPLLCGQVLAGIILMLFAGFAVAIVYPDILSSDDNAVWRFLRWQANFTSLWQTNGLGVGFGTPYIAPSSKALAHALRVFESGEARWAGSGHIYDLIYLRTQHNSFVNAFYRTGIVGGLGFLAFNVGLIWMFLRSLLLGDGIQRQHLILAGCLFVIGIYEISLHVGLETPAFLIPYALSAALLTALADQVRRHPVR